MFLYFNPERNNFAKHIKKPNILVTKVFHVSNYMTNSLIHTFIRNKDMTIFSQNHIQFIFITFDQVSFERWLPRILYDFWSII